jgi:hypothetical protein
MYASGITYTGVSSVSPAAGTLTGADNGLSVSGVDAVLGENVAAVGTPAVLLSNREIPMAGFYFNLFGGNTILSGVAKTPSGARLDIFDAPGAGITKDQLLLTTDSTAAGSIPTNIRFNNTVTGTPGIATPGSWMQGEINGVVAFTFNYNTGFLFNSPVTGVPFLTIEGFQVIFGLLGGQGILIISPVYNTSTPFGLANDIFCHPTFTVAGGTAAYTAVFIAPVVNQTAGGTGTIIGVDFNPTLTSVTGQVIAFRNTVGDILFQALGTTGRVGIHGITTPTAWVHIGAGTAAANSSMLKFTAGVVLTVPEVGAWEYNGTNLFFTPNSAVRNTVLFGTSGAAAPSLTATPVFTSFYGGNTNALGDPNSWASVVIAGTTYKIPLYT